MSGNKFLLDTNAILYILNGDETLAEFLFGKELYISIISEMELLAFKDINDRDKNATVMFLHDFIIVNIDERIKLNAIEVKKTSGLKPPDSIIAATAIPLQLPLVTSDRHFKKISDLNLIYYEK